MPDEDEWIPYECTDCDVRWKSPDIKTACWSCDTPPTRRMYPLYIKTSSEPSAPVEDEVLCYPYGVYF